MIEQLSLGADVEIEEERDSLGGGGALPSDLYACTIEAAYLETTKSGAVMANINFTTADGKRLRMSECIMSKKSGALKATYTDKKTGKEKPLPGYSKVLGLIHLLVDPGIKDLGSCEIEERILKLYDFEQKKEVPQAKNCLVQLHGTSVGVATLKVIETKMAKDAEGKYTVATAETREVNTFEKFFNEDGLTLSEIKKNEPADFCKQWADKFKGKVVDKTVAPSSQAGMPGAPAGSTAAGTPKVQFT